MTSHNYPNPFNPETVIEYVLPKAGFIEVSIYNNLGQKIRTLVKAEQLAGIYQTVWDGRNDNGELVANGIYFYRISAGNFITINKMLFLK